MTGVRGDWSWGASTVEKTEADTPAAALVALVKPAVASTEERSSRKLVVQQIPQSILPLEEHDSPTGYIALEEGVLDDEARNARFLGIPGKLCKLGVKGMVSLILIVGIK